MKFQPVIKWSGSKRSQSLQIVSYLPKEIDTYYEPFVGSGSVMFQLLHSDIKVNQVICSDINKPLIDLWKVIKERPLELVKHYNLLWQGLTELPDTQEGIEEKKRYFNQVRSRFNKTRNPMDFYFLIRTTANGLVRFNQKGEFNNGLHINRNGVHPDRLLPVVEQWSERLNERNVQFLHRSYDEIQTNKDDFLYLDPPYANTKGMYFGGIKLPEFFDWLGQQAGGYALSFDGKTEKVDNTFPVPEHLYIQHIYLKGGLSTFRRLLDKGIQNVEESLYLK